MPTAQAGTLQHPYLETFGGSEPENYPMTLHIILQPADPESLVWVTDTKASLGGHSTADIEKIFYFPELKVACSAWGDFAFPIKDEFVSWLKAGRIDLADQDRTVESVRVFVQHFNQDVLPRLPQAPRPYPGLVLVSFRSGLPHVYTALIATALPSVSITPNLWAGDDDNPAKIFCDYYYNLTRQRPEDALALGIHSMRLAHTMKAFFIGQPNAWIYRNGTFRRLTDSEMGTYLQKSEAIDNAIGAQLFG